MRSSYSRVLPVVALLAAVPLGGAGAADTTASFLGPAPGPARAIGATNRGCFTGGVDLAPEPGKRIILRPARNRAWGLPPLIATLTDLSEAMAARGIGPLLVGDMGLPRGGPMPDGHHSHMSGLDADLWFKGKGVPPYTADWIAKPRALSAVAADGADTDPEVFTPAVTTMLELLSRDPRVDRLFVNPVIKRELCARLPADPTLSHWIGKLRPWWGHDKHVHVRLSCPADSPDCEPQAPVPPGTGCDATLDWWFTEEARTPQPGTERPTWPPPPHGKCVAILGASQ